MPPTKCSRCGFSGAPKFRDIVRIVAPSRSYFLEEGSQLETFKEATDKGYLSADFNCQKFLWGEDRQGVCFEVRLVSGNEAL